MSKVIQYALVVNPKGVFCTVMSLQDNTAQCVTEFGDDESWNINDLRVPDALEQYHWAIHGTELEGEVS